MLVRPVHRGALRNLQRAAFLGKGQLNQQTSRLAPLARPLFGSNFSTMSSLKASSPAPPPAAVGAREYDPEIKDMASYIHNYRINSDLAVSPSTRLNIPWLVLISVA